MSTYIFWNKQNTGCETYEELLILERDGYSYSSCVTLDNPEEVVDCVLNETNADLGYHKYKAIKAIPLVDVSGPRKEQHDANGCIIDGKVYVVQDEGPLACEGCAFEVDRGNVQCVKLACSAMMRHDERDVIWVEKLHHYTGHVV